MLVSTQGDALGYHILPFQGSPDASYIPHPSSCLHQPQNLSAFSEEQRAA